MNPFFMLLIVCSIAAILYWFKSASTKQGVVALKAVLIIVAIVIVILVAIGRLPILTGIPILLLAAFRKFALYKLLIPFIKMLAGSYISSANSKPAINMDDITALKILDLPKNPSREQIVQAHRKRIRELKESDRYTKRELAEIDAAREHLIQNNDE
ncbi:MAG: hypothetical protein ACI9ES_001704 [Oceanospirillaceae bacterium]|jgi:hypothetical protein